MRNIFISMSTIQIYQERGRVEGRGGCRQHRTRAGELDRGSRELRSQLFSVILNFIHGIVFYFYNYPPTLLSRELSYFLKRNVNTNLQLFSRFLYSMPHMLSFHTLTKITTLKIVDRSRKA